MKKKFWVIIVAIVIAVILVMCSSDDQGSSGDSEKETTEKDTEESESITTEESAFMYMGSCQYLDIPMEYQNLLRHSEEYDGNKYYFTVKIVQVMDGGYRATFDDSLNDIVMQDRRRFDKTKILQGDTITAYATFMGLKEMTRAITESSDEIPFFYLFVADIPGENTLPSAPQPIDDDADNSMIGNIGINVAGYYTSENGKTDISLSMYSSDEEGGAVGVVEYGDYRFEVYNDEDGHIGNYEFDVVLFFYNEDGEVNELGIYEEDGNLFMAWGGSGGIEDTLYRSEEYIS